ncbi:WRKY transcription factor 55-like isoform X2 [Apium graveolens]|uniref:WRKY transcription factor 55-like isoform X2 n=1 Tax=Apium graveolens TaxID=4045 RepID=UPI003D7A7360
MEEIVSLIYNGCRLARDLEVNLPNLANQPEILWNNCHEIVRIFTDTRDRINAQFGGGNQSENVGGAMQQWLQLVQQQEGGSEGAVMVPSETERWTAGGRGEQQLQPLDGAVSAARGATFQRMRRRKDDADKRSIRVPAPQMGNTEIPPEDGFTWRKYGQKEILGSRFPRGYYRCTHQKLYQCPAKKQVQRLDNDPFTFEVIYRGEHTCTGSSTAPSMSALPLTMNSTQLLHTSSTTTSLPGSPWLSISTQPADVDTTNTNPFVNMHMFGRVDSSSGTVAGPSTARDVATEDQKWDSGENKQD